ARGLGAGRTAGPRSAGRRPAGRGAGPAPRPTGAPRSPPSPAAAGALGEPDVLGGLFRGREVPPLELAFLTVGLAERDRDLRLHQLAPEVERMGRLVHAQLCGPLVDIRAAAGALVVG